MQKTASFHLLEAPLVGINLIEASAGTGKTWNICGLYLRLLLERKLEVNQILVVTFTIAATAELRTRIRNRLFDTLQHLSATPPSPPDPFIAELIQVLATRRNHTREELRQCTEKALMNFDEAAIFTIHGFCQRALSNTAFASGQAFSVDLIPDESDLRMEVVQDFWRKHVAHAAITPELAAYLIAQKDSPSTFDALLRRRLGKPLAEYRWLKNDSPANEASATNFSGFQSAFEAAQKEWRSTRTDVVHLLNESLGSLNKNSYKEKSIRAAAAEYDYLLETYNPIAAMRDRSKLDLLRASILKKRTTGKNITPQHRFFELAETLLMEYENLETALEHARLRLLRQFLEEAPDTVRQRKRERRLASFDDLLFKLHNALTSDQYPWLGDLLRQRFPAALVDEFQDTDPLQYQIFETLYNGQDNTLYMVGDPKQAIYRFRNADLHSYLRAKERAKNAFTIGHNQRSTDGLIHAVNRLFQANSKAFILPGLTFTPAGIGEKRPATFVDQTITADLAPLCVWQLPTATDGHLDRKDAMHRATQATANEIARLLQSAKDNALLIDGQALQAGHIAVLVRTHRQGSEIKRALSALNVGSIEHAQTSVFSSLDAEEIERVLCAIWIPSSLPLLRAALSTEIMGFDAHAIAALTDDSGLLHTHVERFAEYRHCWLKHGISTLFRKMLRNENVSARMLVRPDGERRLTNLLHLSELLHQASALHPLPDSLLRWLQTQRAEANAGNHTEDAAQLRLESDQNLVQILTVHKSKGLEFPIVFCPFLWDGRRQNTTASEGREYHDDDGRTIISFHPDAYDDETIDANIRTESDAEDLRLIYVALTRAVYRCYVSAGCYRSTRSSQKTTQSHTSLLNWLAAGQGLTVEEWRNGERKQMTAAEIEAAWQTLAQNSQGHITLVPLTEQLTPASPLADETHLMLALTAQPAPGHIPFGWRINSFSGLTRGATHDNAASDHDMMSASSREARHDGGTNIPDNDILHFPKGSKAGLCLHKIFELCDFVDDSRWRSAIDMALSAYPQDGVHSTENLTAMLEKMLHDVLSTPLVDDIVLKNLRHDQRLNELGFYLPAAGFSAERLSRTMNHHGYLAAPMQYSEMDTYLKGFIDLVFEHDGRYYILDWKSNYLGDHASDYDAAALQEAMHDNAYYLQYLLYTVALNRYLALRVPNYDYDTHFGGVFYLFVRGVRPDWKNADGTSSGVFFDRPNKNAIADLDQLFASFQAKVA